MTKQTISGAKNKTESDGSIKYLTFLMNNECYAVSVLRVKEIIEYGEVTPMPMMPDFICGAINIRGKAIPVVDLPERLGLNKAGISKKTCIIIVEINTDTELLNIGLMVDSVSKVLDLKSNELETTPSLGANIRTDFIEAMGKINNHFIILLNIDKILSMDDLTVLSDSNQ